MIFRDRASHTRIGLTYSTLVAMVWCATLASCSVIRMPRIFGGTPATVARLSLIATEYANPNLAGVPSPVVLVLYELADPSRFEGAEFNQLFYNDQQVLGGEVLVRQEFHIEPGKIMIMNRVLDPQTTHLGFVAGYRQIEQKRWRLTVRIEPQTTQEHVLVISSHALSLPTVASGPLRSEPRARPPSRLSFFHTERRFA